MNFDNQSMWSSNNNNTFKGDGIYMNAIDEDFSIGGDLYYDSSASQLGLSGQLLMDSGSEITNTAGDFQITDTGISINAGEFNRLIFEESGSTLGRIYHNAGLQRLTLDAYANGHSIELDADQNIYLQHGGDIVAADLPTSEPAGSDRIWVDNGLLKISGSSGPIQLPTYTDTQRDNLTGLSEGMVIWNISDNRIQVFNGSGWDRISEV